MMKKTNLKREDTIYNYPPLISEITSNLFMGGTADDDVINIAAQLTDIKYDHDFQTIVTMYAWARPADWNVQEFRYGIPDASINLVDLDRLRNAVEFAYLRWKSGDRILIRCQAGLNRSGLVTALVLIKDGHRPQDAIDLIRMNRHPEALFNQSFESWLLEFGSEFFSSLNISQLEVDHQRTRVTQHQRQEKTSSRQIGSHTSCPRRKFDFLNQFSESRSFLAGFLGKKILTKLAKNKKEPTFINKYRPDNGKIRV